MDHMMPKMDGIETTQRLRASGYRGVIIALTANALVGNDELFQQNCFDGFIAKPIDVRRLDTVLNEYIRDKQRAGRTENNSEKSTARESSPVSAKLDRIFCREAEKAAATLKANKPSLTTGGGDIKRFTTTAHAMKTALINIGEEGASEAAYKLEKAGRCGDIGFIDTHAEDFIKTLEALIEKLRLPGKIEDVADITEDTDFLIEQLVIIKTACMNYNDTVAFAALDLLKEKPWKNQTAEALEDIRDALYLDSDFEMAEELAWILLKNHENK